MRETKYEIEDNQKKDRERKEARRNVGFFFLFSLSRFLSLLFPMRSATQKRGYLSINQQADWSGSVVSILSSEG